MTDWLIERHLPRLSYTIIPNDGLISPTVRAQCSCIQVSAAAGTALPVGHGEALYFQPQTTRGQKVVIYPHPLVTEVTVTASFQALRSSICDFTSPTRTLFDCSFILYSL